MASRFERRDFCQSAKMPVSLAELGMQERVDEIPRHRRSDRSAAHAEHIHVIVLDSLPSREMVVDQCRTDSRDLVRADCRSDPAAADGNPSVHRSRSHSVSKRYHIVRIVIRGVEFEMRRNQPRRVRHHEVF